MSPGHFFNLIILCEVIASQSANLSGVWHLDPDIFVLAKEDILKYSLYGRGANASSWIWCGTSQACTQSHVYRQQFTLIALRQSDKLLRRHIFKFEPAEKFKHQQVLTILIERRDSSLDQKHHYKTQPECMFPYVPSLIYISLFYFDVSKACNSMYLSDHVALIKFLFIY